MTAERGRDELRGRLRHLTRDAGPLGAGVCMLINAVERDEATHVQLTVEEARAILALLAPQEAPAYDDGSITIGKPDEHGRIAVIGKPTPEQVEAFNRVAGRAAPQEAREGEATAWREEHDRLLAVYVTAARSAFGGAEKWAAYMSAERALHAHIDMLAAARPAPETREPTQAEIDDACMWYRHDFGLMSDEDAGRLRFTAREWLRAWHKAGARELLGAPAPAEATERDPESFDEYMERITSAEATPASIADDCYALADWFDDPSNPAVVAELDGANCCDRRTPGYLLRRIAEALIAAEATERSES